MEIFLEMEYWLSQKNEDRLTAFERSMLHALRKVDEKFYGDSKKACEDFGKSLSAFIIRIRTKFMINFCKCWNNLDTSYIEPCLEDDMQYRSYKVNDTLNGKEEYLEYLNGKFDTLRNMLELNLKAGAGYIKGDDGYNNGTPCVILTQKLNGRINKAVLVFTGISGKISHIEMRETPTERLVDFGIYYD